MEYALIMADNPIDGFAHLVTLVSYLDVWALAYLAMKWGHDRLKSMKILWSVSAPESQGLLAYFTLTDNIPQPLDNMSGHGTDLCIAFSIV